MITRIEWKNFLLFVVLCLPFDFVSAADLNGYTSEYYKNISLPDCNNGQTGNGVKIISTDADWKEINNSSYNVFCVTPGDYTNAGPIIVTGGGTASAPRWIRWYDPNQPNNTTLHPVNMAPSMLAKLDSIELRASNEVIVDRIAFYPTTWSGGILFRNGYSGGQNSIVNRVLIEMDNSAIDTAGIRVRYGHNYVSVQDSVIRNCKEYPNSDSQGIHVMLANHTRIVNNEIYNCTDGIAQVDAPDRTNGTIIDNNDIYITSVKYSNVNGDANPKGDYAKAENAIDIKAGASDSSELNRTKIIHNRFWGYKPGNLGGVKTGNQPIGLSGDPGGAALNIHFNGDYVTVENNIFYQNGNAVNFPNAGADNARIIGNIIYDTTSPVANKGVAINIRKAAQTAVYLNSIVNSDKYLVGGGSNRFFCNVVFDGGLLDPDPSGSQMASDYNAYFDTQGQKESNSLYGAASDAKSQQYCFYRKLKTSPEQICLSNIKASINSPYYQMCPDTALK